MQVELPPGGFVVLKPAADIIIAASANGARANQRIRGFITSDVYFHRHSKLPRESLRFFLHMQAPRLRHRMLQGLGEGSVLQSV